jgi:hypothetical protein
MAFQLVCLRVRGVSPLLMHNPSGTMKPSGDDAIVRGDQKIDAPDIEAAKGLYALPTHQLYVPSDAFREAALTAAGDIRDPIKKTRMMTRRFGASVFPSREGFPLFRAGTDGELDEPLTDDPKHWEVFTKRVVVKGRQGTAGILRGRARVPDWTCDVEFEFDTELIDPNLISVIVNASGKYPGILDFRPGKKGAFGRFEVVRLLS